MTNQRALLRDTHLGPDLVENAERFFIPDEFGDPSTDSSLLNITFDPAGYRIGKRHYAIAFARTGYQVTAVEPDPGEYHVWSWSIRKLIGHYQLNQLTVVDAFENPCPSSGILRHRLHCVRPCIMPVISGPICCLKRHVS